MDLQSKVIMRINLVDIRSILFLNTLQKRCTCIEIAMGSWNTKVFGVKKIRYWFSTSQKEMEKEEDDVLNEQQVL